MDKHIKQYNLNIGDTPINPTNLNHMDDGIKAANDFADENTPTVLNTNNITSTGTLSASIAGFKRLKIYGTNLDGASVYAEVYNGNSSSASTTLVSSAVAGGDNYMYSGTITISGTDVTLSRLASTRIRNNNTSVVADNANAIVVTRIEGYLM